MWTLRPGPTPGDPSRTSWSHAWRTVRGRTPGRDARAWQTAYHSMARAQASRAMTPGVDTTCAMWRRLSRRCRHLLLSRRAEICYVQSLLEGEGLDLRWQTGEGDQGAAACAIVAGMGQGAGSPRPHAIRRAQ